MPQVQLKTRVLFEICRPDLKVTEEPRPAQYPDRVPFSIPEGMEILPARAGSTWVDLPVGEEPSMETLRAAARAVLTDEMNAQESVTVAPVGSEHIEFGPFWMIGGGQGGTPMTLFSLGTGTGSNFEPFQRPVGSGGEDDPLEKAVLRVSIAVSRA